MMLNESRIQMSGAWANGQWSGLFLLANAGSEPRWQKTGRVPKATYYFR